MGVSDGCTGVSIENLTLDGNGIGTTPQVVFGILNSHCGDLSSVDNVWLYRIMGTGLKVSGASAAHSGPYSNISFNTLDASNVPSTTLCAVVNASNTHGIHQMACTIGSESAYAQDAIVVSGASNNSFEDIRIQGFQDGLEVGPNASSNVFKNIVGDSDTSTKAPSVNVIEISPCTGVHDLVMIGIGNTGNIQNQSTGQTNNSIMDACTTTALQEPYVAMYVLGASSDGGHSRFSTSPYVANWSVGAGSHPLEQGRHHAL